MTSLATTVALVTWWRWFVWYGSLFREEWAIVDSLPVEVVSIVLQC
jgi:hypothetical protein